MSALMTEPLYTCLAFGFILLSLPAHFILERYGYIPKDNIHHNISTTTYDSNIPSYEKLPIPDQKTINRFAILSDDDEEEERIESKEDIELSLLNNINTNNTNYNVKTKKLTYVKGHNSEDGLNLLSNKNEETVDL